MFKDTRIKHMIIKSHNKTTQTQLIHNKRNNNNKTGGHIHTTTHTTNTHTTNTQTTTRNTQQQQQQQQQQQHQQQQYLTRPHINTQQDKQNNPR